MVPGIKDIQLERIYECIRIGMDVYKACLYAQLTDAQIAALDGDLDFQAHVRYTEAATIHDVLAEQALCMKANLRQGQSTESRWLLSKLDRKRYGNGPVEFGGSDELPPIRITENTSAPNEALTEVD
jgi:hypothetical protein